MERTETGYEITPECTDTVFTVTKEAEKRKTAKGKYYYIFRFKAVIDGTTRRHSEIAMTWMAGDILRGLGCKEVKPGIFEWEKDEIVGRSLLADIVHEPDYKDPEKPTAKMKNIRRIDVNTGEIPPEAPEVHAGETDEEIPF